MNQIETGFYSGEVSWISARQVSFECQRSVGKNCYQAGQLDLHGDLLSFSWKWCWKRNHTSYIQWPKDGKGEPSLQISFQSNSGGATKYIRRWRLKGRNWKEWKEYSWLTGEQGCGLDLALLPSSLQCLYGLFQLLSWQLSTVLARVSLSFSVC